MKLTPEGKELIIAHRAANKPQLIQGFTAEEWESMTKPVGNVWPVFEFTGFGHDEYSPHRDQLVDIDGSSSPFMSSFNRYESCRLAPQEHQPRFSWLGGTFPYPDCLEVEVWYRGTNMRSKKIIARNGGGWTHVGNVLDIIAFQLTGNVIREGE